MPELCDLVVAWAYDRPHREHPFIVLGLETLSEAGFKAVVVATDLVEEGAGYSGYDDFSLAGRAERYKGRKARNRFGIVGYWGAQILRAVDLWRAYARAFRRLWRLKPDVVIGSRPLAAFVGMAAAKLRGRRFVYYPFELYGEQLAGGDFATDAMEALLLRVGADAIITQNAARAEFLERRGARVAPKVVRNFKRRHEGLPRGGALRALRPDLDGRRIVLYEGQLAEGRWLDRLVRSVEYWPADAVLVLIGPEKGKWAAAHSALLDAGKSSGRVVVLSSVSQDRLRDYVADADAGVIIYDDSTLNNRLCEPGKLSDYLSADVPVVAPNYVTIEPLIRDYDIGVCFREGTPERIAEAVSRVLAAPKARWSRNLERARRELNWEGQTASFLATVTGTDPQ